MLTCQCNVHPLTPHFYIVELGFTGVYIIFVFLLLNINCGYSFESPQSKNRLWVLVRTYYRLTEAVRKCTHNLCFEQNMKIIKIFRLKIVIFTTVKKSLYVAWAGLRNVKHSSLCTDLVNM